MVIHDGCWSPVMGLRWLWLAQGIVLCDMYESNIEICSDFSSEVGVAIKYETCAWEKNIQFDEQLTEAVIYWAIYETY